MMQSTTAGTEPRRLRLSGSTAFTTQKRTERHRPQANSTILKKVPSSRLAQPALFMLIALFGIEIGHGEYLLLR